jgi:hypothetical protein
MHFPSPSSSPQRGEDWEEGASRDVTIIISFVLIKTGEGYGICHTPLFMYRFIPRYSTVTLFARFLGWSTSQPFNTPT